MEERLQSFAAASVMSFVGHGRISDLAAATSAHQPGNEHVHFCRAQPTHTHDCSKLLFGQFSLQS